MIFSSFIFFTQGMNPKRIPKNPKIIKGSVEEKKVKNSEKELKKYAGKEINDNKVIDILGNVGKSLVEREAKLKIGDIFISAIETASDMLMQSEKKGEQLIHRNDNTINSDTKIFRTNAYIGGRYSKKIRSFLSGPLHSVFKKQIISTQEDALETEKRKDLKSYSGVNQRGTTFLDTGTFLTLNDLKTLCEYDKIEKKISKLHKDKVDKKSLNIDDSIKKLKVIKTSERNPNDKKLIKYRSALIKTKSQLKIFNRMPNFDCNVVINLAQFKSNSCDRAHTVEDLYKELLPESKSQLEKLSKQQLKEKIESQASNFSRQLITELGVRPTRLETFEHNCEIVKSWQRKIPSNGHWYFNLTERHVNGIYVNKLIEFIKSGVNSNMPSSYFLIIEYYGDNRCTIERIKDGELISSVYSPCKLAFEYSLEIKHISKDEENKLDEILSYTQIVKTNEFEDKNMIDNFYPNRQPKFTVDMSKIQIMDENKNAEFRLQLTNSLLESYESKQLNLMKEILKNSNNQEHAENLTHDDLYFMKNSTPLTRDEEIIREDDKKEDVEDLDDN